MVQVNLQGKNQVQKKWKESDADRKENQLESEMQLHYFRQIGRYRQDENSQDANYVILWMRIFSLK